MTKYITKHILLEDKVVEKLLNQTQLLISMVCENDLEAF